MITERTTAGEGVRNVISSMAIENMFLRRDFVNNLIKVANKEKSSEELRREVIKKYARP